MRPNKPTRKSTRLPNYDYSQSGAYFVTICTRDRQCVFGEIVNAKMQYTMMGTIAQEEIRNISRHRDDVEICQAVVMPNHVHLLLLLRRGMTCHARYNKFGKPIANSLPVIVGAYKAAVTRKIRQKILLNTVGAGTTSRAPTNGIWQRSYYDHVIRNEADFLRIWQYIDENPLKWQLDCYFTP